MARLEHVVARADGTKEPSGRSLRGRSAQAQVQVRGYKEEKLGLAARTLCFICPSLASRARSLFVHGDPGPFCSSADRPSSVALRTLYIRILTAVATSVFDLQHRTGRCQSIFINRQDPKVLWRSCTLADLSVERLLRGLVNYSDFGVTRRGK